MAAKTQTTWWKAIEAALTCSETGQKAQQISSDELRKFVEKRSSAKGTPPFGFLKQLYGAFVEAGLILDSI